MPDHMKLWTMPDCYFGEVWPGWYVFLGQHRDSDSLTRSNFICGLEAIGGETETVLVIRESHWAVGWVEWIGIHQDDTAALDKADAIKAALEDYPVIDEDRWSELEYDEACDYWASMDVHGRMEYLAEAGLSKFAARRDYLPEDDNGRLLELLNGS